MNEDENRTGWTRMGREYLEMKIRVCIPHRNGMRRRIGRIGRNIGKKEDRRLGRRGIEEMGENRSERKGRGEYNIR